MSEHTSNEETQRSPCALRGGPGSPSLSRVAPASGTAGPRLQSAAQCPSCPPSYALFFTLCLPSRGEGELKDAHTAGASINVRRMREAGRPVFRPIPSTCADRKGVGSQER